MRHFVLMPTAEFGSVERIVEHRSLPRRDDGDAAEIRAINDLSAVDKPQKTLGVPLCEPPPTPQFPLVQRKPNGVDFSPPELLMIDQRRR